MCPTICHWYQLLHWCDDRDMPGSGICDGAIIYREEPGHHSANSPNKPSVRPRDVIDQPPPGPWRRGGRMGMHALWRACMLMCTSHHRAHPKLPWPVAALPQMLHAATIYNTLQCSVNTVVRKSCDRPDWRQCTCRNWRCGRCPLGFGVMFEFFIFFLTAVHSCDSHMFGYITGARWPMPALVWRDVLSRLSLPY